MLQNARITAFTISELLRENQQVKNLPPPTQTRINDTMNKINYYCRVILAKKNKNLLLWLKKNQRFSITTKCWICKKQCKANDVKVKDRCHITWKYWCSTHKKCYSNLNVTSKIPVLPNLQNYDSHLIFQELGDCNSKRHVISKLIEIYMTFAM